MNSQHLLPGKDASLEETITNAEARLQAIGIDTECASWLNPAPGCWSVHLQIKKLPWLYTNGKGSSRLAAYASALGELFERLSSRFLFADYYLEDLQPPGYCFQAGEIWEECTEDELESPVSASKFSFLTPELRKFYDPYGELLVADLLDNNSESGAPEDKPTICSLPFTRVEGGMTVFFPVGILNNLYVSNGMAAGNSVTECRSQALSEIIERYVKNKVIANGLVLPEIPMSVLQHKSYAAIITALEQHGFSVRVKDSSLGGRFPVICVILTDPASAGAYIAFGANCRFDVAVERTLTELLQGRQLESLRMFAPPTHDMEQVADPFNLESHFVDSNGLLGWRMFCSNPDFPYVEWDFSGSTSSEYQKLLKLIQDQGFEIYVADCAQLGMYCCRFVVPGMSEIYPVDDLLYNNRNRGNRYRTFLHHLRQLDIESLQEFRDQLAEEGLQDQLKIGELIGVCFDSGTRWDELTVGELKAMLSLALGDEEEALTWVTWCIEHGQLTAARKRSYLVLQSMLGFRLSNTDEEDCLSGLRLFFSLAEIEEARRLISGKKRFVGLEFGASWRKISASHNATLELYERLLTFECTCPR